MSTTFHQAALTAEQLERLSRRDQVLRCSIVFHNRESALLPPLLLPLVMMALS